MEAAVFVGSSPSSIVSLSPSSLALFSLRPSPLPLCAHRSHIRRRPDSTHAPPTRLVVVLPILALSTLSRSLREISLEQPDEHAFERQPAHRGDHCGQAQLDLELGRVSVVGACLASKGRASMMRYALLVFVMLWEVVASRLVSFDCTFSNYRALSGFHANPSPPISYGLSLLKLGRLYA